MGDQVELSYKIAGWDQLKMSVVKTSSKDFPSELLWEKHGQWTVCTAKDEGVTLQACQLHSQQHKDFMPTYSSATVGTQGSLNFMVPFQEQRWLRKIRFSICV